MVGLCISASKYLSSINSYMTTTYKSPLVSCIYCKEVKSAKGIFTHYIVSHTSEGKQKNTKILNEAAYLGGAFQKQQKLNNITKYNTSPNHCQHCQTNLEYDVRYNKFCSQSCAATYNNKIKYPNNTGSKPKNPNKLNSKFFYIDGKIQYCKISWCKVCNVLMPNSDRATCSVECKSKLLSNKIIDRIINNKRSNFRRDKRSYMEESFEQWLNLNNITDFIPEHGIKNHITNRWYFVDFYFPSLNLIIELDGKQHLKPKHKAADILRDEYIMSNTINNVFRISYDEYKSGCKIPELLNLLVPHGSTDLPFIG